MEKFEIVKIRERQNAVLQSAEWFHAKWGVPQEAYFESMSDCINGGFDVPQWYIVLDGEKIIAGLGVIENDFHDRKDLSPNICAVYVESEYRNQGIAGKMLNFVCDDFHNMGIDMLYLITDHTSFYERYNWNFLCLVQGDGESEMTRMYIHSYK